jgi:ABC-2 type transport system ATP-binding protein
VDYKCINISKSYHKFAQKEEIKALENVNLTFSNGEIIGLIGLSGSGKSTLVDVLSGNLKPDIGELNYSPEGVVRVYKPNSVKLNKNLSVYDNMVQFGKKDKMSELDVENRMVQLRDIFSLGNYINTKISDLSEENKIKCEMAITLLSSPKILFIDEALSSLGHAQKNEVLKCLKRLNKEERTIVILVASSINDVDKIINRVILIDQSKIIYDDAYVTFKDKYCTNKIFEVFLNKNVSVDLKEGITIIDKSEYHYKLSFVNKNGMLGKVINLFDVDNIVDLTIGNVALLDVIEEIRKGE